MTIDTDHTSSVWVRNSHIGMIIHMPVSRETRSHIFVDGIAGKFRKDTGKNDKHEHLTIWPSREAALYAHL